MDNIDRKNKPQAVEKDSLSIMVIDDSATLRSILTRILTQLGHRVTQCNDGEDAWNMLQNTNQDFDLAICDLEMPNCDGYKVLKLIRDSDKWNDLPVIILTSHDNDSYRRKAFDLGANDYLTKPFNPQTIVAKITCFVS